MRRPKAGDVVMLVPPTSPAEWWGRIYVVVWAVGVSGRWPVGIERRVPDGRGGARWEMTVAAEDECYVLGRL